MVGAAEYNVSLDELQSAFNYEVGKDNKAAAETAYALAVRYRSEDVDGTRQFNMAKEWATRAIELLDSLPSQTLTQVASVRTSVGGIPIPELLHSSVVRQRLADVLI